ncbi:glycosyltransferase [Marinomonas sp. THO17]|uniref:glycosyltransferase n=1 Tax=Marinomonas sp. THO17 TaxID=3149048 RepID=UPI00336BB300
MILYLINSLDVGGAEIALKKLILNLPDGVQVKVVTLKSEGKIADDLRLEGIDVFCLNVKSIMHFPSAILQLNKIIKDERPEIIQSWLYYSDLVASFASMLSGGQKIIWGIRTTELKKGSYITAIIRKVLSWLSYWIPTKIVVVAEKAKEKHIEIGYDASKMKVIPNGFDIEASQVDLSSVSLFKKDIGISKNDFVIGCIGRLSQDKGQDVFIAAADLISQRFPSIKFLMVGRDLELSNSKVTGWINKTSYPDNFILVGERSDVSVCLKAMDIFCLPSRSEGFPNVLGEAMLAGVPCISTDAGDAAALGGENVPIAEINNSIDLANKLIDLLEKTVEERNELGLVLNQRIVEKYSVDKMVSRYIDLYKELEGYKR